MPVPDAIKVGIGPGLDLHDAGLSLVLEFRSLLRSWRPRARGQWRFRSSPMAAFRTSGDMAKAPGRRSIEVMGRIPAGRNRGSPRRDFPVSGRSYKSYRGMGSVGAMARGSADRYFQQDIQDQFGKLVTGRH